MIRRVTGTSGSRQLTMNYRNIKINQNIPDAKFDYNSPSSANVYKNFLFEVIE